MQRLIRASATTFAILGLSAAANAAGITSPLNVRSGPGREWPVVATLPTGADVEIQTCASGWRNYWCQVHYGELTGYVLANALQPLGREIVAAPVVTRDAANLRAGPSLLSQIEEAIPGGETVNVMHCRQGLGRGWCKVSYEDKVGYVRGGLLARNTY